MRFAAALASTVSALQCLVLTHFGVLVNRIRQPSDSRVCSDLRLAHLCVLLTDLDSRAVLTHHMLSKVVR